MEDNRSFVSKHLFELTFIFFEVAMIVVYSQVTTYGDSGRYYGPGDDPTSKDYMNFMYPYFQHVQVMMFIGFGFLMTFLRSHSWTSVGVNFLISVVVIEMYIIANGFWSCVFNNNYQMFEITMEKLVTAEFCVAAALISFGGVLGKLSPFQLLVMTVVETWLYALNEEFFLDGIDAVDLGGSMVIHTFGAYYGLMVSWVSSPPETKDHPHNGTIYHSNVFAWIGTLFLWIYWPSFNGVTAQGVEQHRAVINTVLSLTASTLVVFIGSSLFHGGKFQSEDAINATLAGGVMMGSSADLILHPYGALIVGSVAGALSVIGFNVIQPWLAEKLKLYDTCGINNLHGMPGIGGGLTSVIVVGTMTDTNTGYYVNKIFAGRTASYQSLIQFVGLCSTLIISIVGGLIMGLVLRLKCFNPPKEIFQDSEFWVMNNEDHKPGYKEV